jgi:hypothetical protein
MKRMFVLAMLLCVLCEAEAKLGPVSSDSRKEALRRAQVWKPTEIARMDILRGPENDLITAFDQTIECEYVETEKPLSGVVPKFLCKHSSGEILRVKYGEENEEIYSEVAATRLFWALGFYADEVYPVQVICSNCPEHPFHPDPDSSRGRFLFKDATVERTFRGSPIEEKEDQGWNWSELEKVDAAGAGGAPRAQIDALKLLTVFVNDADTKPDNQRLACFQEQIDASSNGCKQPVLMVQDLGATFGAGFTGFHISKMDLDAWKKSSIWNRQLEAKRKMEVGDPVCVAKVTSSNRAGEEGLNDPLISEDGRKFLAGLLSQLSDQQIAELFRVARVERLKHAKDDEKGTVNDWVAVFKEKRKEIQERRCGED